MQRLTLVPVDKSHAVAMFPVLTDTALYSFTGGKPPRSVVDVERWFSALETRLSPDGSERWLTWIVQLIETSTPIGYVQATVKDHQADIAWLIGVNWQGRGYGGEAVAALMSWLDDNQIDNVTAHIHPDHKTSQRIAQGVNLQPSGVFHEGEEIWSR